MVILTPHPTSTQRFRDGPAHIHKGDGPDLWTRHFRHTSDTLPTRNQAGNASDQVPLLSTWQTSLDTAHRQQRAGPQGTRHENGPRPYGPMVNIHRRQRLV